MANTTTSKIVREGEVEFPFYAKYDNDSINTVFKWTSLTDCLLIQFRNLSCKMEKTKWLRMPSVHLDNKINKKEFNKAYRLAVIEFIK